MYLCNAERGTGEAVILLRLVASYLAVDTAQLGFTMLA